MKVLIIEDEAAALNSIKNILGQLDASMEIAGCFDTVLDSVDWFQHHSSPDLIFMDIHLADGSAFNIFECVTIEAPIIFTTAYDQYAINAFQVNSVDYILKPITIEKVKNALDVKADYIVSTDMSCLLHMDSYIKKQNLNMKVMHIRINQLNHIIHFFLIIIQSA